LAETYAAHTGLLSTLKTLIYTAITVIITKVTELITRELSRTLRLFFPLDAEVNSIALSQRSIKRRLLATHLSNRGDIISDAITVIIDLITDLTCWFLSRACAPSVISLTCLTTKTATCFRVTLAHSHVTLTLYITRTRVAGWCTLLLIIGPDWVTLVLRRAIFVNLTCTPTDLLSI
jgi:hypothetical protein